MKKVIKAASRKKTTVKPATRRASKPTLTLYRRIFILGSLAAIVALIVAIPNHDAIQQQVEGVSIYYIRPTPTPTTISKTITYHITKGWNAVTFPFALPLAIAQKLNKPVNMMAYDIVLTNEVDNMSRYTEIDGYANGQWTPSVFLDNVDGLGLNGKNYPLVPGVGYALNSDVTGTIQVSGVIPQTPIIDSLQAGWNLIGIPNFQIGSTASDVLYNLYKAGFPMTNIELDRLVNGTWQRYTLSQFTVNDFPITNYQAYALYVSKTGNWTQSVTRISYSNKLKLVRSIKTAPATTRLATP